MPTKAEPDCPDLLHAKASSIRCAFIHGLIGEATYRASLAILGLRGQDIDAEVALAKMEQGLRL